MFEKLLDPATLEFFAKYVISGYVIFLVANAYVSGLKPKISELAIEIVLYSMINQLIWLGLTSLVRYIFTFSEFGRSIPELHTQFAFYLQILALPTCIGIVSGLSLQRGWGRKLARIVALPLVDPFPRTYDHVFAQFRGQKFVVIAYEDGKNIYGLFGYQSRASRDVDRSELYIERLYDVDGAGKWTPTEPAKSALVSLKNVRAIEFIPVNEDQNGT